MKPALISGPILLIIHFFMARMRKLAAGPSFYQHNGKLFVKNGRRIVIGSKMTAFEQTPGDYEAAPSTGNQLMDKETITRLYKPAHRLEYSS